MRQHADETPAERRGEERAEAAHERLENARERARVARREAADAPNPNAAEVHREEAEVHDRAARLQDTAEKLQRDHVEEVREEPRRFERPGDAPTDGPGAPEATADEPAEPDREGETAP
jgi:hypothetical protein